MKKILMSIHPEWCEKIFNCEKTIEVRKTRPKLEPPFEVYVYCTRSRLHLYKSPNNGEVFLDRINGYMVDDYDRYLTGKVIGTFVCDRIDEYAYAIIACAKFEVNGGDVAEHKRYNAGACLTGEEMFEYSNGKSLYGWHITEPKLLDKPRYVWSFMPWCEKYFSSNDPLKECCDCEKALIDEEGVFFGCRIFSPPQSWRYVEV